MRPTPLLTALALLLIAPAAHADWDFGEHFWLETTMGMSTFVGVERSEAAFTTSSLFGVRVDDEWGVEFSAGAAFDPLGGVTSAGATASAVFMPDEAVRVRMGARTRFFAITPSFEDASLIGCWDCGERFTGMESVDVGFDLGVVSQWNLGPFFVGVEWIGWYQPMIEVASDYVYYEDGFEVGRGHADWDGMDLPAEVRVLNLSTGLTF